MLSIIIKHAFLETRSVEACSPVLALCLSWLNHGPRTKDQGPRTKDQGLETKDQGRKKSAFGTYLEELFECDVDIQEGCGFLNYTNGYVTKASDIIDFSSKE